MKQWWTLLRIPNVLIALACSAGFYYAFIDRVATKFELQKALSLIDLILFLLALAMVMMGAYIINDISDIDTDSINRPNRPLPSQKILTTTAFKVYLWMLIIGTGISIGVSWNMGRPFLAVLYPLAYLLLYVYAAYLKNSILWGNILISLLCGLIPFVLLIGEWPLFVQIREISPFTHSIYFSLFIVTSIFTFITTLARELVKIVEDLPGDQASGIETMATKYGEDYTILFIQTCLMLILGLMTFWTYHIFAFLNVINIVIALIPLVLLILYIYRLTNAEITTDRMHKASLFLKIFMLVGLFHILITALSI